MLIALLTIKGDSDKKRKARVYHVSWKINNFKESNTKKKQRHDIKNEAKIIESKNFTGSNRKSPILLLQYCTFFIGPQINI